MESMKTDITSREDLTVLMTAFYHELLSKPEISYIFTDVAKMNMKTHLPLIVDFWEMIVFQKNTYEKNVMKIHESLNLHSTFRKEHFNIWLRTFNLITDRLFSGTNAELVKQRALSIATMMQIKLKVPQNNTY